MKSRWMINLLLLCGVSVLAGLAWLDAGVDEEQTAATISTLQPDEVNEILIQRRRHPELLLRKDAGGSWVIQHDPLLPAEGFHIDALIKRANQEAVRSYPASELDPGKLDLEPPASSITLNGERIDFGRQESLEALRYARSGDRVLLIPDLYQYLVDADFSQFVRRRLFADDQRIIAMRLPTFSLQKNNNAWQLSPEQPAVSADDIQRFIDRWQSVTAVAVQQAGEPGSAYIEFELDHPSALVRFSVRTEDDELLLISTDSSLQYRLANDGNTLLQPVASPPGQNGD